jgi:hypothetical protein
MARHSGLARGLSDLQTSPVPISCCPPLGLALLGPAMIHSACEAVAATIAASPCCCWARRCLPSRLRRVRALGPLTSSQVHGSDGSYLIGPRCRGLRQLPHVGRTASHFWDRVSGVFMVGGMCVCVEMDGCWMPSCTEVAEGFCRSVDPNAPLHGPLAYRHPSPG